MPIQKYHISIRILHWLMAIIILALLVVGIYMTKLDYLDSKKETLFILHKSFGVIVFGLIWVRIFFRLTKTTPALPGTMSKPIKFLAHCAHYLLYLLMIFIPISGYLMSNFYGFPVIFFNTNLPNIVGTNTQMGKLFGEIHEILAYSLIAVLIAHIAAVIKHRFFDIKENDILSRII